MTVPFRLAVLQNLSAAFETITIANGYNHDLATSVFRGRDLFGANDPVPALVILEPPVPLDMKGVPFELPRAIGQWELLIQGWVKNDREAPTDPAHWLMADVKRCLAVEKKRVRRGSHQPDPLGMGYDNNKRNHVQGISRIGSGVVRPPGDGVSDKAYFWLDLALDIVEDIEDPFV